MSCGEPAATTNGTIAAGSAQRPEYRRTVVGDGTIGWAPQAQRTHNGAHFPSGWVSVADVQASGVARAMTPEASPSSNATTAIRKSRDT